SYLPNIAFVVIILLITHYIIRFTHFIFKEIEQGTITIKGFDPDWADTTYGITRFLLTAFSFVLIFPYLPGSGSPAFQQVSIFLGVLLSLSSTGAISHVIAGIFLTYTGAFKAGDRVKIADTVGDVMGKTLFATRIRTNKNEEVTIPNGLVLSDHIVNYSSSASGTGLILHAKVTIGYEVPWRTVHKLLIDAALQTERILPEPPPFVLQTDFDGSSVVYEINAYTNFPRGMQNTYSNLRQRIQDQFTEANIEILTPVYHAVRDGSLSTVPAEGKDPAGKGIRVTLSKEPDLS
ncbi:MAG TPA: mechanosensitive ion channel domain-containing protein, partial [Chroococcales cyanobacterium]